MCACGINPNFQPTCCSKQLESYSHPPWAQDNGEGFKDDEEAWGAMYDGLGSIMCGSHMPLVRSGVMRFMHKSGHVKDVECVACG